MLGVKPPEALFFPKFMKINTLIFDLNYFVLTAQVEDAEQLLSKCLLSLEYEVTLREKSEHQ